MALGYRAALLGRHEDIAKCPQVVPVVGGRKRKKHKETPMNLHLSLSIAPIIALIAGILILIVPRLLNFIVAIYLIITGLLGLFGNGGSFHMH
jgi:hypothetical protein